MFTKEGSFFIMCLCVIAAGVFFTVDIGFMGAAFLAVAFLILSALLLNYLNQGSKFQDIDNRYK